MKKLLLFTFIFICLFGIRLQAQNCVPNPIYADSTAGVYPLPDPLGSETSSLNAGCTNSYYEQLFTAVVPDSILDVEFSGSIIDLALYSVLVDSITGLPPGVDFACEPPTCLFEQLMTGCVLFSGVPTEAGTFYPVVHSTVSVNVGIDLVLPVNFPSQPDDMIDIFPGQYTIKICEDSNCGECVVSTDNAFANVIGLQQNIPNPFSTTTRITIATDLSGEFDFKVFNLMGKMVHYEQVNIISGENTITFDGSQLESGVYLYAIGQGKNIATNRMIIKSR